VAALETAQLSVARTPTARPPAFMKSLLPPLYVSFLILDTKHTSTHKMALLRLQMIHTAHHYMKTAK
jgi:hypothetical protein